MKNQYILFNDEFITKGSLQLTPEEWAQWAGTTISLVLFASGNRVPLLPYHHDLLQKQFESVGWLLPSFLDLEEINEKLEKLLNKNRSFKGSRIHWLIIPGLPTGTFAGITDFRYLAIGEDLPFDYFPLNKKGLSIGVSERFHNAGDPFYSSIARSRNRELLVRQEALVNGWDEIILPDPAECLSETPNGNVFLRIKNHILTPSLENHALPRVMQQVVRELCHDAGLPVEESSQLTESDLLAADEIFITDDLHGIRWIMSYQDKRYYRKTAAQLSDLLRIRLQDAGQFQRGFSG
ncbi:MAG: aminotransferase class IV [Bacteroidales bacterium]